MKFNEVYVPVFEEDTQRQLRTDFGSKKMELTCTDCWHEFTKRVGPSTGQISCPECGHNRVKPAVSEETKKKLMNMKESMTNGDMQVAINESLEVISELHGRTDTKYVKLMIEALNGLVSIERGLKSRSKEFKQHIVKGTGFDDFKEIALKLGREDLFNGEE